MDVARRNRMLLSALVVGLLLTLAAGVAGRVVMRPEPIPLVDQTLVFIAPHPDDETYAAAMTLGTNARAGREVIVVMLTDGEGSKDVAWWIEEHGEDIDGDGDVDKWDFGLSRRAEFEGSMRALGVTEWTFMGAAASQGEAGIRDGEVGEQDIAALVRELAAEYPGATLATVMKAIPGDSFLGDVLPHEDHAIVCDAVDEWAEESGSTAYFFKPYASLKAAWYRRSAPHRLRGDEDIRVLRTKAIAAYQLIGRRSWYALYFANMTSELEYMVTSDEF